MLALCTVANKDKEIHREENKFKKKGDVYASDCNLDATMYKEILVDLLLPRIKKIQATVWGDDPISIEYDGAPGHRAEGIEAYLFDAFSCVSATFVRQPP